MCDRKLELESRKPDIFIAIKSIYESKMCQDALLGYALYFNSSELE